jgi:ethanolamine utilization cobalamin adenosyltransferase
MDDATKPQYLVSRSDQSGPVKFSYPTAATALTKARELLEQGHLDVRICTPRGRIFVSDEFDQLDG